MIVVGAVSVFATSPDASSRGIYWPRQYEAAREEYFAARRGVQFGIPRGAHARAVRHLRRFTARHNAGLRSSTFGSATDVAGPSWQFIGPHPLSGELPIFGGVSLGPRLANSSGPVTAVLADPSTPGRVFVGGATGGLWMRASGSVAFAPIFDSQPTLAIGSLALDTTTSPTTLYVGTGAGNNSGDSYYGEGIFVSSDLGASWTQLGADELSDAAIAGVAIDTSQSPRVIYAAVSYGSSASRTDASWTETNYAQNGLWRSTDGGALWKQYPAATFGNCPYFTQVPCPAQQVVRDPATSNLFVSILGTGVFRSTDSGTTWTRATLPAGGGVGRASVAVRGATVYVSVGAPDGLEFAGFFKSTDSGSTWSTESVPQATVAPEVTLDGTSSPNVSESFFDQGLAIDPSDSSGNTVVFGGVGIYRSTDGGQSWTFLASRGGTHAGQHAIAFDPASAHSFLLGNDGGLFEWSAAGSSWTALNSDIATAQIQSLAPEGSALLAGLGVDGVASFGGATSWNAVDVPDGGMVLFDQVNSLLAYRTSATNADGPRVSVSSDSGQTWTSDAPTSALRAAMNASGDAGAGYYPPLAADPSIAQRVLFGAHSIYVSTDAMQTWTAQTTPDLTGGCPNGACALEDIEFAPSDRTHAWALAMQTLSTTTPTPFRLMRTVQADVAVDANHPAGALWTDKTPALEPMLFPAQTQATGVTIDPFDSNTAWLSVSGFTAATGIGHVFVTHDFGDSWSQADGNPSDAIPPPTNALPDVPVLRLLVDRNDASGATVLAGTDIGVFRTTDGGATWSSFDLGTIPAVPVFDLEQNRAGSIFAGTFGRGAFELAASSGSTATPTPTTTPSATSSATPTPSPTPTSTATPTATATSTPTATASPTPTSTATPTALPTVASTLTVHPAHAAFPKRPLGSAANAFTPRLITVVNRGNQPIAIQGVNVSGDFELAPGASTCGATLAPRARCDYGVSFVPTAPGLRVGFLTLLDDARNRPQTVKLTGRGIAE